MTIQNINFAQYAGKTDGTSTLSANEWNTIMSDLDTVVDAIPESSSQSAGGSDSGVVSTEVDSSDADKTIVKVNDVTVGELTVKGTKGTNVALSGNNNINIEPRPAAGTGEDKNTPGLANRKGGNISLKPGDDIELCSHKRGTGKNTEVAVKVIDGSDNPVKLQVFAGDITLSTKGKGSTKKKDATTGADTQELLYDDPNVMNVNVTTGTGKGYLKVRARAIDLRCEDHGGIALQPKGKDGQGHENKIKFEHGGGDGLEFGTFNTEKTSIFTNEYRFNKDGVWKMATRQTETSDKADGDDSTTALKYVKQSDDFYDIISNNDRTATTNQIIAAGSIIGSSNIGRIIVRDTNSGLYNVKSVTLTDIDDDSDFVIEKEVSANLPSTGSRIDYNTAKIWYINDNLSSSDAENFKDLLESGSSVIVSYKTIADGTNGKGNLSYEISRAKNDIQFITEEGSILMSDIIRLVNYMKSNHQGPWANA